MEDLPLCRIVALVPEVAVKYLPLGITHDDDVISGYNLIVFNILVWFIELVLISTVSLCTRHLIYNGYDDMSFAANCTSSKPRIHSFSESDVPAKRAPVI